MSASYFFASSRALYERMQPSSSVSMYEGYPVKLKANETFHLSQDDEHITMARRARPRWT